MKIHNLLFDSLMMYLLCSMAFITTQAQTKPLTPPKYEPTEVEHLKLENLQQKAIIDQQQLNSLNMQRQMLDTQIPQVQDKFSKDMEALNAEANLIKKAHHWNAKFDPNTLVFSDIPVAPSVPSKEPAKTKGQ